MALPIRTTLEDADAVCRFLIKKPTGASSAEARKILDAKYLDGRKLAALKLWGLIEEQEDGRLKIKDRGRLLTKDERGRQTALLAAVKDVPAYAAIVERVAHRNENSITALDAAAHWHEHFPDDASENDKILNDQAVCFFQLAAGTGLGTLVIGRKGAPTRFEFNPAALRAFTEGGADAAAESDDRPRRTQTVTPKQDATTNAGAKNPNPEGDLKLGQAIFVAHGKNKKPLEQLKKILDQFKIPHRVATEEPNLGRPIGTKVREIMQACTCAILIFTADEQFRSADGNQEIWRPSENVVFELGASGYLYGSRIVIMKEDAVEFPTNFRELGYISFAKDQLEAKAMEILKELIGFGIVKVST
jgi:predicted nucleotide-binding protein